MDLKEKINKYLLRKSKPARILRFMLNKKYVTNSDIINFECVGTPLVFTTNPQKIIQILRDEFGYDFVKDEDVEYVHLSSKFGKEFKKRDTYKRYFLNYEGV